MLDPFTLRETPKIEFFMGRRCPSCTALWETQRSWERDTAPAGHEVRPLTWVEGHGQGRVRCEGRVTLSVREHEGCGGQMYAPRITWVVDARSPAPLNDPREVTAWA
jgi:hypothetical protein